MRRSIKSSILSVKYETSRKLALRLYAGGKSLLPSAIVHKTPAMIRLFFFLTWTKNQNILSGNKQTAEV